MPLRGFLGYLKEHIHDGSLEAGDQIINDRRQTILKPIVFALGGEERELHLQMGLDIPQDSSLDSRETEVQSPVTDLGQRDSPDEVA
jgi:hypothetical protein